ncbi:gag-pol, partial [Mucuna pruriens]
MPFELMCNASNLASGAILSQRAGVGKPVHVIAYASRTMDPAYCILQPCRSEILAQETRCEAKTNSEFNIEIRDKKGAENSMADHLSRIEQEDDLMPIKGEFLDEQLLNITTPTPWFADICNFASRLYRERLQNEAKYYKWDDPYLWRLCNDQVTRRCIPDTEINLVGQFCHGELGGGHYGSTRTDRKVLDCGFYWPTIFRDTHEFVSTYEKCQKAGVAISRRHEMPQQPILFYKIFNVWGIDFMGPFPIFNGYSYILLAVDYVSRWVEVIATKTNNTKVVVNFLKSNIFCQFGVPKALISDQGNHFCNKAMSSLLHKYGVVHRIAKAYHPQTNGQAKDALWAHRTVYGTPLGMSPYRIVFGKACHLPVEMEHRAYWALQELDELRLEAYENSQIYKQKFKQFHNQQGKLRSRWKGPFVITNIFPYGAVELRNEHTNNTFHVNGHQIKLFHEGPTPIADNMETISLMEPLITRQSQKTMTNPNLRGAKELWNCLGSRSRSSMGETPGEIARTVHPKMVEKQMKEKQMQDETKKGKAAKTYKLQQKYSIKLQNKKLLICLGCGESLKAESISA